MLLRALTHHVLLRRINRADAPPGFGSPAPDRNLVLRTGLPDSRARPARGPAERRGPPALRRRVGESGNDSTRSARHVNRRSCLHALMEVPVSACEFAPFGEPLRPPRARGWFTSNPPQVSLVNRPVKRG